MLMSMLNQIKRGAGMVFYGEQPQISALYTRLASAITALICDPEFNLSYDGFVCVIRDHATLHSIYKLSAFGSMDYVIGVIGQRSAIDGGGTNLNLPWHKLLMCWSLESEIDLDFEQLSTVAPEWVSAALLAYLAIGGIHNTRGYERKVKLSRLTHLIEKAPLHEGMLWVVADVYMHCSYMDAPDKHAVKPVLNRLLRKLVEAKMSAGGQIIHERMKVTLPASTRPTVVIPLDWFHGTHSMFRCYAPSVRELRRSFRLVGVGRATEVDEVGRAEFDKFIMIDDSNSSIDRIMALVAAEAPDIIWYPSIGMSSVWVALSNFRLAPIQIMSPGHPASSYSECIDYIISDDDLFGDRRHYTERCVSLPVGGARYIGRSEPCAIKPDGWKLGIQIAVPAMVMKLIPPFLETLKEIAALNPNVRINFFPNMVATYNEVIKRELTAWVPDAVIHERMEYAPYMALLSQCDFMLSSFPFGGTNSVIDAFMCGLPVVTWEGDQIHERSDASMIRRVGLPEWMIAHSREEYIAAAKRLIDNEVDRRESREYLQEIDIADEFFGPGPENFAFLKAVQTIYTGEIDAARKVSDGVNGNAGVTYNANTGFATGALGQFSSAIDAGVD